VDSKITRLPGLRILPDLFGGVKQRFQIGLILFVDWCEGGNYENVATRESLAIICEPIKVSTA